MNPTILLATSCLQARHLDGAVLDLLDVLDKFRMGPDGEEWGVGIQLCPGNVPSVGDTEFVLNLRANGYLLQPHHSFYLGRRKGPSWAMEDGTINFDTDAVLFDEERSIHPPMTDEAAGEFGLAWATDFLLTRRPKWALEVPMYAGYLGATIEECLQLLDDDIPVAVDVSHLNIQRLTGGWKDSDVTDFLGALNRRHELVREIHVSANDGKFDQHRAVQKGDFGIAWARDFVAAHPETKLVLECYMHKMSLDERVAQLQLVTSP